MILKRIFPYLSNNNYNNLQINDEALTYITTHKISQLITDIIISNIPFNINLKNITIFDMTACVGGDSITFSKNFGNVISCEDNTIFYNMLINNLNVYDVKNIITHNEDSLLIYKNYSNIDILYIDPPWGGKDYKKQKKLRLKINEKYIDEIINDCFSQKTTIKLIVLKLPKNYDLYELYQLTEYNKINIYLYRLDKMNIIIFNNYSLD
jgi:16S rRNA G966 N2-methylase RsmD